jgi:hypothetical protein
MTTGGKSMRDRRVAEILQSRGTSEGLYQALKLKNGSYALVVRGDPVQKGDVLPINPRNDVEVEFYDNLAELERDWQSCMDDIENSDIMLVR